MTDNDKNNEDKKKATPLNTEANADNYTPPTSRPLPAAKQMRYNRYQETMLPEPEAPSNALAKLYHSWSKNEIEWKIYKEQYMKAAEKQAELMLERADHVIARTKEIHNKEIQQLREMLKQHNAEVITGMQTGSHEDVQQKLIQIADQYVKKLEDISHFPQEIRDTLMEDAKTIWNHSRRKILKYGLERHKDK